MIELPPTNPFWHTCVDEKLPEEKPSEFLLRFDLSHDVFNPFWHVQIASYLNCISIMMMEGIDIPTEFKDPSTGQQLGNIVIIGEESTHDIPSVSLEDFANILKDVVATPTPEGDAVILSLPKKYQLKGGE